MMKIQLHCMHQISFHETPDAMRTHTCHQGKNSRTLDRERERKEARKSKVRMQVFADEQEYVCMRIICSDVC